MPNRYETTSLSDDFMGHKCLVGLAFIQQHRTRGSVQEDGARGQNLVHIQKIGFLC